MRRKLIKLLRTLESKDEFRNEYVEFDEQFGCDYSIDEYLECPDYRFVISELNKNQSVDQNSERGMFPGGSIKAELIRMEAEGLVMIGLQEGIKQAFGCATGPDFENLKFKTERVVLTTKGKSQWRYFFHKANENPVTTSLSLLAVLISIIALFT